MATLFSVLVSIYVKNTELEIRRCFDSLQTQICRPSEVIIVIDGPVVVNILSIISEYGSSLFLGQYLSRKILDLALH